MSTGGSTAVAGRAVRAPRPRPLAAIERALSRLTLPVLLLMPALIIIAALVVYPLGRTFYISFTDTRLRNLIRGGEQWVGLDNYKEAFTDGHLAASLVNTVVFGTACVIGTMVFGFAVALLLNQKLKGNVFFGLAVLLPWAVPAIAASAIWRWLFNDRYGFVNWGLTNLGLHHFKDYAWFADRNSAYFAIFVTVVWQSFPFIALSLLGRVQTAAAGHARRGRAPTAPTAVAALPPGHVPAAAPDHRRAGDLLDDLGLQDLRPGLRDGPGRARARRRHRGRHGLPRGLRARPLRRGRRDRGDPLPGLLLFSILYIRLLGEEATS